MSDYVYTCEYRPLVRQHKVPIVREKSIKNNKMCCAGDGVVKLALSTFQEKFLRPIAHNGLCAQQNPTQPL